MKGDFSRSTFNKSKHYAGVLMQQGRVQLDADWNEQVMIVLHTLRSLAADLIGPHGGPGDSFKIGFDGSSLDLSAEEWESLDLRVTPGDFILTKGHYYVDGILAENEAYTLYTNQPNLPEPPLPEAGRYLAYLDVWERHLTYHQDPAIREVALGGNDTTTRIHVVWQVKIEALRGSTICDDLDWEARIKNWQPSRRGQLKAGLDEFETEPGSLARGLQYRGSENQLYRVEIHQGGVAGAATFKWSRENGSVIFPILKARIVPQTGMMEIVLGHLGQDSRFGLQQGDRVELLDDAYILHQRAESLLEVSQVDLTGNQVTIKGLPAADIGNHLDRHPILRRWDHREKQPGAEVPALAPDGALRLEENRWLPLENGVQVYFEAAPNGGQHTYRTGDYWLIPARVATRGIEWPGSTENPAILHPDGVEHHYAPLAVIDVGEKGLVRVSDCRCSFPAFCGPGSAKKNHLPRYGVV